MEVLKAATSVAAEAIGLGGVVGTLEVGKEADIIVVNGDPTADIRATGDVALVMRAGEIVRLTAPPPAARHCDGEVDIRGCDESPSPGRR